LQRDAAPDGARRDVEHNEAAFDELGGGGQAHGVTPSIDFPKAQCIRLSSVR
jgi:hypothetical protein